MSAPTEIQAGAAPKRTRHNTAKVPPRVQVVRSDEKFNLSEDEKKIIMDFRLMSETSRGQMRELFPLWVEIDRKSRLVAAAQKFKLIQGGA